MQHAVITSLTGKGPCPRSYFAYATLLIFTF